MHWRQFSQTQQLTVSTKLWQQCLYSSAKKCKKFKYTTCHKLPQALTTTSKPPLLRLMWPWLSISHSTITSPKCWHPISNITFLWFFCVFGVTHYMSSQTTVFIHLHLLFYYHSPKFSRVPTFFKGVVWYCQHHLWVTYYPQASTSCSHSVQVPRITCSKNIKWPP